MSTDIIVPGADAPERKIVESPEGRSTRIAAGILLALLGLLLVVMAFTANPTGKIALSDAFADVQLPTIEVPSPPVLLFLALLTLASGAVFLIGRFPKDYRTAAGVIAGLSILAGFVVWAAASSAVPFTLTSQLNLTLAYSTPLLFGVLAGVLSERAGVVNIAIEGQFLAAAFAASVIFSVSQSFLAALAAAAVAGLLMGAVLALFTLKYLVDHVIVGVVVNLLATGLTGFIFQQLVARDLKTFGVVSPMPVFAIPALSEIPFIGPILFTQRPLTFMALLAVPLVWFLLHRTKWGLRVRAVGEHPRAADTVGIKVISTKTQAVLLGGIFAGLGGAYFTVGFVGAFQDNNITAGNGFIALAAVIMGRWHPVLGAGTALFFGFARALAQSIKLMNLPIPSEFIEMLPYVATIIAVAGLVGRVRPPAADGAHFVKTH
ncbi:ABC transporter permease [Arachnia propionica]|uniref:ABC transporter permease n=1 Tax=Arachnia propionica TaxID=1750 RepID=UPI000F7094DC|nr:ABC transporter permease [Arachnia propionica]VEJ58202.1 beta-methylgalactoside transporter inner membrane component [Arachnia propionica]